MRLRLHDAPGPRPAGDEDPVPCRETETPEDRALPPALAEVAEIGFEGEWDEEADEARGCDFELYDRFEEPARTAWWFRLWH